MRKFHTFASRVVSFCLLFALMLTTLPLTQIVNAYEASQISIDLVKSGAVDVMLVSKNSNFDTDTMQQLETKLRQKLPSSYDIRFVGLETKTVTDSVTNYDASTIYNTWAQTPNPNNYVLVGNTIANLYGRGGQQAYQSDGASAFSQFFVKSDSYEVDDFEEFSFRYQEHGCAGGSGVIFHTQPNGACYMLCIHASGAVLLYVPNYKSLAGSFYAPYAPGTQLASASVPNYATGGLNYVGIPVNNIPDSAMGLYSIKMVGNRIIVKCNGNTVMDYTDNIYYNNLQKGAFGLYANCCATFRGVSTTYKTVTSKTMTDILRQATWRDEATHLVIDVDTLLDPSLTESGELTSRLIADNVYLQFWGTNTNQNSFTQYGQSFGKDANNIDKYNFVNQSSGFDACVTSTANYIKRILSAYNDSQYGIVNEITDISVIPAGAKNNTADSEYPYGKWKIVHDNNLIVTDELQNDMGVSNQSNMSMNNLTCSFDKPGNYVISYMNVPIKTVYIHRRPVADFTIGWNSSTKAVSIDDTSYDLDTNKGAKSNGIKNVSWKWKKATSNNWINGYPTTWSTDDGIVIIQLTVTDYQGCSSSVAKYLGDNKPVAAFSFNLNPVSLYEDIMVLNSSYDTTGYSINKSEWIIKNSSGAVVATNNTNRIGQSFSFGTPHDLGLSEGTYTVCLTVTNTAGTKSEQVSRTLHVSKVTSHAIYEYNWKDAHHSNYPEYVDVFYRSKYPNLQEPKKYYRVSYKLNTGTQVDYSYSDAYSVFNGWYKEDSLNTKIVPNNTVVTSSGNHTIYAKWSDTGSVTLPDAKKIYTVTYNPNGTALDKATSTKASDTETWSFTGWYDKESNGIKVGDKGTVINNVNTNRNYYAYWRDNPITLANAEKKVTISYNGNGGTSESNNDTQATEFKGWFTAQNGGTYVGTVGNKYTVNNNHTLYAHFGNAKFILPNAEKDGYTFIGWFSQPQTNDVANNNGEIRFYGKAGQEIQVDSSRILYAWYNSKPVFSDTDISNVFYEGQTINGSDLLTLVTVNDKETQEANKNLVVNLVDVTYKDGTKVPFDREKLLDTKTDNIGKFFVKYTVTDYGIEINGNVIESSPVTVEYVRECEIRYNDLPSIKTEPYLYTYTGDKTLTKDTIESFVKSYVTVNDYQDDIDNRPWWNATETKASLINNIEVVKVTDIQLNSAYVKDNAEFANTVKSINSLQGIYSLKETAPDAFNAITSYNVVFDVKDQWGKYTSGRLSNAAIAKGVKPSEKDKTQTDSDRSVLVICTNDASYNNAYDGLRYVSSKYIDTVNANSYWGDYGKNELRNIFDIREKVYAEEDIAPTNTYVGVYKKKNGNNVKVTINDYTK